MTTFRDSKADTLSTQLKTLTGFKAPSYTTTQRDALAGEELYAGEVIFNSTTSKLNFYTGSDWQAVTSA